MLPLAAPRDERQTDYPLTLNTGRVRDQWHTMTRTGRVPHLMKHAADRASPCIRSMLFGVGSKTAASRGSKARMGALSCA